ncbi:phosphoadenosine phosphosulfate reductase [Rhodococcus sp. 14-2483-1-1]|uniref:Putative phosphoadenosine phosphosulfate (PAPS) reductase n=1 Tax=Rhodococcoides fascians D188 TaxID=1051973 RepID=G8JZ18_RHOFA|nr:phosphoadenosine phosphosulfate reductase family protein [Rhodococcus fascians]OZC47839.1 phosphoadenosine phosphosulfate reductase [Rhodococcus sp. 06-621-2]OZC64162.1 phosphoadenosine phosphosulfate reductase [Rhodococcus sp. 06-462-5]OZC72899.1 phosphoadenosine phosphosulfate reductase [Rhodococcus sp. 06-469-3-2]OZD74472.1 phosphoadenosine phosphosulfate reductase [Rhodococcus sp. 06-1059B-a]OZD86387.1 phosphoadenosine phosphosulfate reductase [Rhodococcus sp. 05-2256-B3]OZD86463.1 pho
MAVRSNDFDGLDLTRLRSLRSSRHDISTIVDRVAEHLDEFDGYVAFSGGKDSVVAVDLARQADPDVPVAFFDSGLEYPETYAYVEQIATKLGLDLHIIRAEPTLLTVMARTGEWDHGGSPSAHVPARGFETLIAQPARAAHTKFGDGEVWGVRADESRKGTGRWSMYYSALAREISERCQGASCCSNKAEQRRHHGGTVRRTDGTVAYGPVWDWSADDVLAYSHQHDLPSNPVYAKLAALGAPAANLRVSHILDGNFLESGRVTRLRRGWPSLFEEIAAVLPRIREFV